MSCVTHHHACECREAQFREALEAARTVVAVYWDFDKSMRVEVEALQAKLGGLETPTRQSYQAAELRLSVPNGPDRVIPIEGVFDADRDKLLERVMRAVQPSQDPNECEECFFKGKHYGMGTCAQHASKEVKP